MINFSFNFGIIVDDEIDTDRVLIKVSGNQEKFLRSLPLHHSQEEEKVTPEFTIFSYHIKPTFDFRKELLSYGSDIEVLEPIWFRDEIAEIISKQYSVYQQNDGE